MHKHFLNSQNTVYSNLDFTNLNWIAKWSKNIVELTLFFNFH